MRGRDRTRLGLDFLTQKSHNHARMHPQDILYIQFIAYINTLLQLFLPLQLPPPPSFKNKMKMVQLQIVSKQALTVNISHKPWM